MSDSSLPTEFAPAERAPREEVVREAALVQNLPLLCPTLNAMPDMIMILNRHRQVVFANRTLLDFLGIQDLLAACGARPGEAVGCLHASDTPGGCGTTEYCRECGAVRAILSSQQGRTTIEECRIQRKEKGEALDLRIWASPYKAVDGEYTLFVANDISHEKRRKALERIFFHDLLNTAGGLLGYAHVLREATPAEMEEFTATIALLADKLIGEINAQRELVAAESNDLSVNSGPIRCRELIGEVVGLFQNHTAAKGRQIKIDGDTIPQVINSDQTLLRRVLINMVRNALEASEPGQQVTIGCRLHGPGVEFWVHNDQMMPRQVQLQIFQRSFSTKGSGRGLGTYSMKLLSEHYLKGQVSFVSTAPLGTTFFARYPMSLDQAE